MNFLTRFSLKNPAAMIIMAVIVAVAGVISAFQLKKETMPDISIPVIAVMTPYPGASPSDISEQVTKPLEKALSNVSDLESVTSTTSENSSAVIVQFSFSADMDEAKKEVDEAVSSISLPEGALDSVVSRISFDSFPVMDLSVSNDKLSTEELQQLVKETVVKEFESVDGVAAASFTGETNKSVAITLLPEQLKKHKLTSQAVKQQLEANHIAFPVGAILDGSVKQPVKVSGKITSLDDLKNLQIPIYPDQGEEMKKAFEDIGDAIGGIAEGMGGVTKALNGQNQLLSAIHDTESALFDVKLGLAEASSTLKNPNASPQEKATASHAAATLTGHKQVLEKTLAGLRGNLASIQKQLSAAPAAAPKKAKSEVKPSIKLIPLHEIATVEVVPSPVSSISRINGKNSLSLGIIKSQEANTVNVSDAIKEKMESLEKTLPEGTEFTIIFDQADMVKESVNSMLKEGALGALFACIIILFFLRNVRSTLISVISIPLSLLIALLFMKQLDITLNILTLGALAIAVGRVVDDSIVVIENIYRHLQEKPERSADVIRKATGEVIGAITSSTLTTIAVFLPLGFVSGMIGVLFKPFAFAVVIALSASLFVAVTVVPLLAKFLLLRGKIKPEPEKEGAGTRFYRRALTWSLNHKFITLLASFLLFVSSVLIIPLVGTTFMPASEEKYINLTVELPAGTDIGRTDEEVAKIEELLEKEESINMIQSTIGSGGTDFTSSLGPNGATLFIQLKDGSDVERIVDRWTKLLQPLQQNGTTLTLEETNPESGESGGSTVEVVVKGNELEHIKEGALAVEKELKSMKSLEHVKNNLTESKPEVLVDVDQEKSAKLGLSAAQVSGTVKEHLGLSNIGTITFDKQTLDLTFGVASGDAAALEGLRDLAFTSALGDTVKLSTFADVKTVDGPVTITSKDGSQYASVTAAIKSKNTGEAAAVAMEKVEKLQLPKGVEASVGGTVEQMNESFAQLGLAIAVAIATVYLLMVIAFGEAKAPFAILFSLPLALIGGIYGLLIARIPLDMPGMIGFLMLIGIVVTNAIVLIDRVQKQREDGVSVREALIEAGAVRLRPILMTALATMGALAPLAIGLHSSTILSQSLAIVVIGGLASSTILTLVVVPVMFELLNWKRKKKKKKKKQTK